MVCNSSEVQSGGFPSTSRAWETALETKEEHNAVSSPDDNAEALYGPKDSAGVLFCPKYSVKDPPALTMPKPSPPENSPLQ